MASVLDLKKSIVTYTADKTDWKWSAHTLGAIAKADAYKDTKIRYADKLMVLMDALDLYQKMQDTKRYTEASEMKDLIWSALDTKSQARIKKHYDLPEARIASVNKELPDDDTIVAFYALIEDRSYNGEAQDPIPTVYKERFTHWRKVKNGINTHSERTIKYLPPAGDTVYEVSEVIDNYHCAGTTVPVYGMYYEDHIINTNSEVEYSDFMETSPNFYWLPKAIAVAKQFGITPNWQACWFGEKRGIGLTAHDAKELQQVANWYSGLSDTDKEDLHCDWSDLIWIHHEDGVHSIQISEREYRTNPEKWADWRETECRDLRCDLYADTDEDEGV